MKLSLKQGRGDKIHISVDGEYKFTVDKGYCDLLRLYDGMDAEAQELEALEEKIKVRRAYNQAVVYLSRRDHSERELILKLRQKGYKDEALIAAEKLKNEGYIDDYRFAELYIRELSSVKKYGAKRISQELYKKGISREIINELFCEFTADEGELKALILRKYSRCLNSEKGIKKAASGLMRMGYSYSEIKSCLSEISEEYEMDFEVTDE